MTKTLLLSVLLGLSVAGAAQADSSAFFLQKGLEEKTKGRRMESLKQFERAYAYNARNREVVGELASAYLDLRRYPQAREKFQQLEALGNPSPDTYRQLMQLSFNLRQFPDAIRYAQLLKKADPSQKVAYYIGKAHYDTDNLGEAIKYFDLAAKEDPTLPDAPYYAARAYADMQNFKQAIPYFQKAIALKPADNRWIYEMALIYYGMNDDRNALKYMLEAAEKGYKRDAEYLQNLSVAYLNAGKVEEGTAILKEALQRRTSDAGLIQTIAQAYYEAKRYNEAIEYYDQLLALDKTNAEALYMIGMSYQGKGEKAKGIALCDKAIEMDPSLQNLKQKRQMPF